MSNEIRRSWGYWTQAKLEILDEYLGKFLLATSRQSERIFLDAFAGEGDGVDRLTGEQFKGSSRIALERMEGGGFTRLFFFEKNQKAPELERRLVEDYPNRPIQVVPGDCNQTIPATLLALADVKWAPTFAFIDPDGMEVAWETLVALAEHKKGYRRSQLPEYKVELWMLFSAPGVVRTLALDPKKLRPSDEDRATRLFGCEDWRSIYERRCGGQMRPDEAREELVNLMRWRIEKSLGYNRTHALELKNLSGVPIYHMIFATDNAAGDRIMTAIYANAMARIPEMRAEAKDRKRGQLSFDVADAEATPFGYEYEAPWKPQSWAPAQKS